MTNEQLNQYYSKDADKKQCWVSKDYNCPLKEQCNGLVKLYILNKRSNPFYIWVASGC